MLFSGGPATEGPGLVVGPELREPIRSHNDLVKESDKHYKKAVKVNIKKKKNNNHYQYDCYIINIYNYKYSYIYIFIIFISLKKICFFKIIIIIIIIIKFYNGLAKRAAEKGQVIDIFAGCLDQIGLQEMKGLVNETGGYMILSDSFTTAIFKQSFIRILSKDSQGFLNMGFNAVLEVQVNIFILLVFFFFFFFFLFFYFFFFFFS